VGFLAVTLKNTTTGTGYRTALAGAGKWWGSVAVPKKTHSAPFRAFFLKNKLKGATMGFYKELVARRAKEFGLTEEETRLLAKRVKNFIESETQKIGELTDITILKSFFIINKMKELHKKNLIKNQALAKNKNKVIEQYFEEIVELREKGWGSRRIAKFLKEKHKKEISHTTLSNFFKEAEI